MRPFWPGEDYTRYPYQPGDVVVDNPPFSILMEITRWYNERGIPYLLFAHPTTSAVMHSTLIVTETKITYQSGLEVLTSFITNMLGDTALITAPELREYIEKASGVTKRFKSYTYPECVLRISEAGMMARRGIRISIGRDECAVVRNIGGHHLIGLSYVLTDAAIDRLRHVRQRIDRPGAIPIQLSPEQQEIARRLEARLTGEE